ncbi:hypothetical protein [Occultella kanbiaonis]|uniref:hypothetical protein n=1 Tax=Occultella kanbiaonis TaxID=2675754 RepID=UPI0012B927C2|nr:hypothetical protein [Occultella kanbiaonis]
MLYSSAPDEQHDRASRAGVGSHTRAAGNPQSFVADLQRSAGNRAVDLWLRGSAISAERRTPPAPGLPVQRYAEQNNAAHTFDAGALVDHTTHLVLRADRLNRPSGADLGKLAANADKQMPPTKKNGPITWKAGTNTGISLMANSERIPDSKRVQVVLTVPDSLQILQTGPADHAEFHTTAVLTAGQIGAALESVTLVDQYHGDVVQRTAEIAAEPEIRSTPTA